MASNPNRLALYTSVGPELTHYDVDVEASTLDRLRHGQPAGQCPVCLATRIAPPSLCRDQRQRLRHGQDRQHASRDRIPHRSGQRCAEPARRSDQATDAADPHGDRHPFGIHPGCVQQPECNPRLPDQCRCDARRGGDAAGPIDPGIFAHQVRATPGQPPGDSRHAWPRCRRRQAGGARRTEGIRFPRRRAAATRSRSRPAAAMASGHVISISIRPGRGSTCRWSGRTNSTCSS